MTTATEPRARRQLTAAVAVVGYALLAAVCRPLTWPAVAAVLLPGAVLGWLILRRRPSRAAPVAPRGAAVWIVLGIVATLGELALFVWGNDAARPTLSMLSDPLLATYPGRVAGYTLWLGAGVWLAGR